jgi:hypothetical protein
MPYLHGMKNAHTTIGRLINGATNCPPASETDSLLKKAWKTMATQAPGTSQFTYPCADVTKSDQSVHEMK